MADTPSATPASMSKKEAVRRAMNTLGMDAGRQDILKHVKEQFGVDMTIDHVSTYRADIRRKKGKKGRPKAAKAKVAAPTAKKTETTPAAAQTTAPKTAPVAGKRTEGISASDLQKLKDLLARNRPDELKAIMDVLAK